MSTLVSILIPCHNAERWVGQAIESALAQTYARCEVIVVNDGSTDGGQSEHIAKGFGARIRYFNQPNGGVASALNRAVAEMRGSYFSWLSHDDMYLPQKVERQVTMVVERAKAHAHALALAPDTAAALRSIQQPAFSQPLAVYSDYRLFSDDGSSTDIHLQHTTPEEFRYRLALRGGINGCTLLIPVEALRASGGFDERLRATQDYALWFRLAEHLRFVHLPDVLVAARVHAQQGIYTQSHLSLRECLSLHAGFARDLRDDDMPDAAPAHSPGDWYALLAKSFWQRGFAEGARIAEQRARLHGVDTLALRWGRCRASGHRLATNLLRRLLSPTQRARIRQCLQGSLLSAL